MDGAHVSDVRAAASQCATDGRLRYPGRDSKTLSQTKNAQTGANGKDREMLGAVPVGRVLVFVAELGCEDDVGEFTIYDFQFPICDFGLRLI